VRRLRRATVGAVSRDPSRRTHVVQRRNALDAAASALKSHSAREHEVQWQSEYKTVEECVPNVLAGNRGFLQRESVLARVLCARRHTT
jgi:hypothetical protein